MTAADKLHQIIQDLSESQLNAVIDFAENLHQKQQISVPKKLPSGTLTGLRGLAKGHESAPSDEFLKTEYIDHRTVYLLYVVHHARD